MVAVLRPPCMQDLDRTAVPFDREGEVDDVVDLFDLVEKAGGMISQRRRAIEVRVDLVEKVDRSGHGVLRRLRSKER